MSANANIEMVRLKFCSYNYEPLIAAIKELRKIVEKFPNVKFTTIPLPNKKKYYCVNRSPHVNTNSREQFGIEELSQIAEIKFVTSHLNKDDSFNDNVMSYDTLSKLFSTIKSYNVPPGVYCEMYSKWDRLGQHLFYEEKRKEEKNEKV